MSKSYIELPKPDKRYKVGKIVKDEKGAYRGHPLMVIPKRAEMLANQYHDNIAYNLNPPIVISAELAVYLERKG